MLDIKEMEGDGSQPLLSGQNGSSTPGMNFMTPAHFLSDFAAGGGGDDADLGGEGEDKGRESLSVASEAAGQAKGRKGCVSKLCVLATVGVLAVLGVVGFFLGGPSIAASELNGSSVAFTRLTMSDPSADDYSFEVQADVMISDVSPLDGTIGEMAVDLIYKGTKLGRLQMPAIDVKAGQDNYKSVDSQRFVVEEDARDVWDEFSNAMLMEGTVDWTLEGTASVTSSVLGISMTFDNLDFHKEIPLTCFDGLDDVQMSVFDLTQSTPDQILVEMSVCLKNPSDISISNLGDMYFGVYYGESYMGNVTAESAKVEVTKDDASSVGCEQFGATGYNLIPMFGNLEPSDHDAADELMSRYLSGQDTAVSAKALSPVADSLPMFNQGMQGLSLDTTLNGDETPLIVGIEFKSATISPVNNDALNMAMVADVSMQNPLGPESPLYITEVNMVVDMSYAGATVGTAKTFDTNVPEPNEVKGNSVLTVPAFALLELPDKGAALTKFAKDLINLDSLDTGLLGDTSTVAYCPALGYSMNIAGVPIVLPNEDTAPPLPPVSVQGMGGLKDVSILSYSISGVVPDGTDGCTEMCGLVMGVTARVNNPSPFGLEIGTLNGELRDGNGVTLGTVGTDPATNFVLSPGINNVTMTGKMSPQGDDAILAAADFMSAYMNNSAQVTTVYGTDAGDTTVSWLNDIVNGVELSALFPGAGDDFEALTEIDIKSMDMELTADGRVRAASTVRARLNVPPEVDQSIILDVDFSGMKFDLIDVDSLSHLGRIELEVADVPVIYEDGYITATFDKTDLVIKDFEGMQKCVKDLMVGPSKNVLMKGTASPHVKTGMGVLQLSEVPFEGQTIMYGYNNLLDPVSGDPEMKITKIDIASGETGKLNMLIDVEVINPSNVKPELGAVTMELWTYNETDADSGFKIGEVTVEDFILDANEDKNAVTTFKAVPATYITPTDGKKSEDAGSLFLSNFVSGINQTAALRGAADGSGTDRDLLKPALAAMRSSSDVPGLVGNLLRRSTMHLPNPFGHDSLYNLPTDLYVYNPFSADMTMTSSHCDIYPCKEYADDSYTKCKTWYEESAGYYTPDALDETVKAGETKKLDTKEVKLNSILSREMIQTLFSSAGGGALIKLNGTMGVSVGDFHMDVYVAEHDVPICLAYAGSLHDCDAR
mmetsp:Transcript_25913/g.53923  ORF Transcript_25913/g.53923 Transcript_25913/m.53923 type:complete len:1167 (-) Transcript_25913:43-3543(-)